MRVRSITSSLIKVLCAALLAFGLGAGTSALAGTTNKNFDVYYAGGTVDVSHQTKSATGTSGYVRLSHNYPTGKKAQFRMATGGTGYTWTGGLKSGQASYLNNTAPKGKKVRMDVKMNNVGGTTAKTLKGYWGSN